ncbi:MAG: hypothetical protein A3F10_06640 [Coxiella sp. RIFCSPHIGHO2_12_FULL_42_15]|nr:MAG: hypothetical protein A3F10_06640 [Coxiella sp. RIFCSPHIGHO2_12_FULL_42_15]
MKRALVLAATAFGILMGSNSFAYTVGLVDIQKILASEHGINKLQSSLNGKFGGERDKLQAMGKKLQADSVSYEKNKAVMSKADAAKKEEELKKQSTQVQLAQSEFQQKYMQAQQTAMKDFVDTIKNAASEVAKNDKLDAVFIDNSVLFAKESKDITDEVLAKMK